MIFRMMGIFQAGRVQLNLVAGKTPIRAQKLRIVKRFARFLNNPAVRVREGYHPFAELRLASAANAGQVHRIIDATKVAFGFRRVMVSLAYRRRSLPLAWSWGRGSRGHRRAAVPVKWLAYVQRLLPRGIRVSLVGDCEFGTSLLIENLRFWHGDYVLRQAGDNLLMLRGSG